MKAIFGPLQAGGGNRAVLTAPKGGQFKVKLKECSDCEPAFVHRSTPGGVNKRRHCKKCNFFSFFYCFIFLKANKYLKEEKLNLPVRERKCLYLNAFFIKYKHCNKILRCSAFYCSNLKKWVTGSLVHLPSPQRDIVFLK